MAGANSGRGNAYQSKANPPRPDAKPAPPKPRSTLKRSTRRTGDNATRHTRQRQSWERELEEAWIAAVVERAEGRCEATGEPLIVGPNIGHHVIEQSVLWSMRKRMDLTVDELVRLLWDRRNGMAVNSYWHKRHDDASDWSIPRSALRDWHWEFASVLDRLAGTGWATARLERDYPEVS